MERTNKKGHQKQGFEVFRNGPQKGDEQNRHAKKPQAREENRRHGSVKHNPAGDDNIQAPNKADQE